MKVFLRAGHRNGHNETKDADAEGVSPLVYRSTRRNAA
jgi:hypothetical protein